ncbi:transposase [Acidiphilium sp. PA]|uniref:transposase n=1 Tax=Acidiphilium sp. PA TaxID=2871705 RepID=UPI0038D21A61
MKSPALASARKHGRDVVDQSRSRLPKLAGPFDEAEADVRADMDSPPRHRAKIHSADALYRLNGEIKPRADAVRIASNAAPVVRLIGALLLEQNEEWAELAKVLTVKPVESQRRENRTPDT